MVKCILIFVGIVCFKAINNFAKLFSASKLLKEYESWIEGHKNPISGHRPQIKRLVKDAGITDIYAPYLQEMGYGQLASANVNLLNLYPTDDANYAIAILQILQQTVSVYKSRLAEAINPLYWINVVIFLPRTILEYLGAKGTGLGTKVLQLIYWICGTVLAIWKDEIFSFIRDLMSRVIS